MLHESAFARRGILVTGAAAGIGRATAVAAARAGARVYAVDRDEQGLAETLDLLGAGHTGNVVDLADFARLDRVVEEAAAACGRLDALAHVAAVIVRRPLTEVTEADWDLQYSVNLKATFFLDRAVAEHLVREAVAGSIVNVSSQGWWTGGYGGSVVYSATKAGVVALTRGLARSYAERGIRINAVAPGAVDTRMMREGLDDSAREAFVASIPLGRMGQPEELANSILYLLSDAASYITGATLNVSGGQLTY